MLAGAGVLREEVDGRFTLTPLGITLRSDGPDSVRDWALFVGAPEMWQVWAGLRASVMSGESAFQRVHGAPMWEYIPGHPDPGTAFNRWMTRQSNQPNSALVATYDFSPFRLVADIGGGPGPPLARLPHANTALRGVSLALS